MRKKLLVLTIFLAVLMSSVISVSPASARRLVKPEVWLTPEVSEAYFGDYVLIRGEASREARGARVRLYEYFDGQWDLMDEKRVRKNGTFKFTVLILGESELYRAKIVKNKRVRGAKSPVVEIRGVETPPEPELPEEPTNPEDPPADPENPADPEEPIEPEDPPADPEEPESPKLSDYEFIDLRNELLAKINKYRQDNGVGPLYPNSSLDAYAQSWSDTQREDGQVIDRSSYPDPPAGLLVKNEFVTINGLPDEVFEFLLYQEPNLLLANHEWFGVGMSLYDDEIGYWTLDFADTKIEAPEWTEEKVRNLILQKTNEFRAQNGKAPLKLMGQLDTVAQDWTRHMATTNTFQHNPNFASQYPSGWTRAGENIAAGQQPEAVVNAWINSAGHRANLLGDYTHIGIGFFETSNSTYKRYYTQNFAKY